MNSGKQMIVQNPGLSIQKTKKTQKINRNSSIKSKNQDTEIMS